MPSFESSDALEITCASRAYRVFIKHGYTHLEACDQIEKTVSSLLKPDLSKEKLLKAVAYLRIDPKLNEWNKYPLYGG